MVKQSLKILIAWALMVVLSCEQDDTHSIKQEHGRVWLSGGLAYCAEQIHLTNGDTLIVRIEDVIAFQSGDLVRVKYRETGVNEYCPPHVDCEIIEIKKIE